MVELKARISSVFVRKRQDTHACFKGKKCSKDWLPKAFAKSPEDKKRDGIPMSPLTSFKIFFMFYTYVCLTKVWKFKWPLRPHGYNLHYHERNPMYRQQNPMFSAQKIAYKLSDWPSGNNPAVSWIEADTSRNEHIAKMTSFQDPIWNGMIRPLSLSSLSN